MRRPILAFSASAVLLAWTSAAAAQDVDPRQFSRPPNVKPYSQNAADLAEQGKRLWTYTRFGSNGQSCSSCHGTIDTYSDTFLKPYPHFVQIVKDKAGLSVVDAEQMVQFCVVVPLEGKPLDWSSKELAALAAYVEVRQKLFEAFKRNGKQPPK